MKSENRQWLLWVAVLAVKCILLTVFNGFSVWVVFLSAPGIQGKSYSRVLPALLVVLLMINALTLLYPFLRRRCGTACSRGWAFATAALYVVMMLLCCLFYWHMPTSLFTGCVFFLLLIYTGLVAALFFTRHGRRRITAAHGDAATLGILDMREKIQSLHDVVEPRLWSALDKAYTSARTSWEFASPFGRCEIPAVMEMEEDITRRLTEVTAALSALANAPSEDGVQASVQRLLDIADRLHLREKLLLG